MAEHVEVKHKKIKGTAMVPVRALKHYQKRGWTTVESKAGSKESKSTG